MAVMEGVRRFQDLRLDTGRKSPGKALDMDGDGMRTTDRYDYFNHDSALSEQMRRAESYTEHVPTPPISIRNGQAGDDQISTRTASLTFGPRQSYQSSLEEFKNRRVSITFDPTLKLDSGARHHMEKPLEKPSRTRVRGRSLQQEIAEEKERQQRPHSESDRNQYNPITGEPIPHDKRREREGPHVGELRHPLLPATVDELARESQTDLPASMTTETTLSPSAEEVRTPPDNQNNFLLLSPVIGTSPLIHPHSYEENPSYRRHVDRSQTAAADFFTRAGSLRKSPRISTNRQAARRSTSSSTKSPRSAASSFLASFSAGRRSRSGNGDCFDARPASPDAEGQTIGDDYVLGKQIGFGGFSVIKEAFHINPQGSHRKIAAKVVRRNIEGKSELENEQAQAEFDHEVELWRFLKHPRILPLEAVYKTSEATFCFIPLNKGGTLFDLVRANRAGLPTPLAKRYAYQLATAIRYLHEDARVAHRDVKLENCLLDTTVDPPNVRLCDFGMAEWLTNDYVSRFDGPPSPNVHSAADRPPPRNIGPSDTSTTAFAGGSLEYAAPEIVGLASRSDSPSQQQDTDRGVVSPASDIWALGVCIYTLIVGSRPFQDSFQPRVTMAILAGEWDQERLREKGGEEALELVRGCLEMDVRERWDINEVLGSAWLREEVEADVGLEEGYGGMGGSGW